MTITAQEVSDNLSKRIDFRGTTESLLKRNRGTSDAD
jgi:hypothetical protein